MINKFMKRSLLSSALLILSFSASVLFSQNRPGSREEILSRLYDNEIEQYFSFQASGRDMVSELGRIISIDNVDGNGKVYAYANRREFSRFLDYGLPYEILPHPGDFMGELNIKTEVDIRSIEEWDFYPSYSAYLSMMYQFETDYPELCQIVSIGTTVEGRELLAAKISDNIGTDEAEPQFLYTSSMHGDELTGYVLMLRLIDHLLSNYGSDPRITSMVDNIEIWINPLANPDGTYYGGNNTVYGAIRYNANGTDLNRNFPDPKAGPYPTGPWETETIHFMELAEANHFVASTNIHGGTEVCNYPWDTWEELSADDSWWQFVCHEYADTAQLHSPSGYMAFYDDGITNGWQWYEVEGGRQDYMNYFHQCREFTLEISNDDTPDASSLPDFWEYNYRSFLNYIEQCTFGIRGTVKDSVTDLPIKAEIIIPFHDKDSSWVYSHLPHGDYYRPIYAGTYSVRFSAAGYVPEIVENVTVTNRQATVLNVKLVPEGVGGIENNQVSRQISIYPNPAQGNILHYESTVRVTSISILDLTGKEIKRTDVDGMNREIEVGSLESGMYFVRFETEKGPGVKRIVKND
jgi:hypothetical protein